MTRYFLSMMTGNAASQKKVFSEPRLELNSVLFRNENRESFVLERVVREEKDDRLEALLQAEVAMVPRLAAALVSLQMPASEPGSEALASAKAAES